MENLETNTEYQDNDFKYIMQDFGSLYIGARFSYSELLGHEMATFKLKSIIEHYIMKDTQAVTTLESQLYYMTEEDFSYKTYMQLKTKVKACLYVEKKSLFGEKKMVYRNMTIPLDRFVKMNLAQKKKYGVKIQEIAISKLALMAFSV